MRRQLGALGLACVLVCGTARAQEETDGPAEAPPVDPAEIERLQSESAAQAQTLEEQEAALQAQQEALAEQAEAIAALQEELAQTQLDLIPPPAIQLGWEGHYRLNGFVYNHLFASQTQGKQYHDARLMTQRLWLRPVFDYEGLATLKVEFRALDDIVLGDNNSNASTALFAEVPSETDLEGQNQPSVTVARAWTEFSVPVGILRVGRMPSDWGMGLLANSGDRDDHKFGISHYASTNDRILFGTRPVAVYETIAGKEDSGTPLIFAVAVDRLVEDPLIQYYGYKCEIGRTDADPDFDGRCDTDGDGSEDADHGFDADRTTDQRDGSEWWVDPADDVWEMVYVLVYRGEGVEYLGGRGDLTAGTYIVHRKQQETESNVVVADLWLDAEVHGAIVEFEGIHIFGTTQGITLPGSFDENANDPLLKTANIWGYAANVGYGQTGWKVMLEQGYASGDDRVTDNDFTGRPLNPDHNVGLLLYEEVLAHVTRTLWTEEGRGLWSRGGVYNSRYVFPTMHVYPMDNWEFLAGFLTAWPDKPDGANIICNDGDKIESCPTPTPLQATASTLGWELDLGLKHTWHEHLQFRLEAGIAHATDRIPLESVGLNPEGKFFTMQSGITYRF